MLRILRAQFVPSLVRHLRDWQQFTLVTTFEAFQSWAQGAIQTLSDDLSLASSARVDADTQLNAALATGLAGKAATGAQGRSDLGLGGAALLNVGTVAGTVAAGNHTHASITDGVGTVTATLDGIYQDTTTGLSRFLMRRSSSTVPLRFLVSIEGIWTDATDATRTSAIIFKTVLSGGNLTERARINSLGVLIGDVQLSNPLHDLVISTPFGGNASFRLLPYLDDIYFDNTSPTGDIYFRINAETKLQIKKAGWWFIPNALSVPATDPVGGGALYCEGGALKYRGSSGTVTTLAPA